ncbi:major facilitator superfamily domain-containing protein [Aspergillus carlsbadensis]|nr:major facilitator superfamily domain-containing protein [Aspergillus carlsbadensis]
MAEGRELEPEEPEPPKLPSSAADPDLTVSWAGPEDPANPMNWTMRRKWGIIAMISFVTFLTPLASSMFAPGVAEVMQDFNTTSTILATFVVSVYILGFAFGPLIVAPLSEYYGRMLVYNTCNFLFFVFNVASAVAPNMAALVVFRFLDGVAGVAPTTIGSGNIGDIMPTELRGRAMALWSLGPLFGPVIGPVVGGYLVQGTSWRWVFWVLAIVVSTCHSTCTLTALPAHPSCSFTDDQYTQGGIVMLTFPFLVPETHAPTLLERKAARLRKETGNEGYISQLDDGIPSSQRFRQALVRPTRMLLFSPIVAAMCIYIAALYGLLYILFTTFAPVFQGQYGFTSGTSGLAFLGSGAGMLVGLLYAGILSDRAIKRKLARGLNPVPEDRLPLYIVLPGSLSVPAGLFIYGWATENSIHWMLPEFGNAVTGFGMILILMGVQTYLVDAFTVHAASAIAACTILRSLAGGLIPLGGLQLYDKLGLGWGNSLLAFIALALAPIPVVFRVFGERLRARSSAPK